MSRDHIVRPGECGYAIILAGRFARNVSEGPPKIGTNSRTAFDLEGPEEVSVEVEVRPKPCWRAAARGKMKV